MRVLSYNIHKGIGNDRRYRLERVIKVIEEERPDVICLQEVDTNVGRSNYHDQPRLLAEHFNSAAFHFQLNVPNKQGGYGNLVLSRWSFLSQHQISLRMGWRKPRGAQMVVVNSPHGAVHVVNWHLGLREKERRWQATHLLQHDLFSKSSHLPTVIVGDYNDWRNKLDEHVFSSHRFQQATWPLHEFRSFPSFWSLTALDKLFFRGHVTVKEARIVRTRLAKIASDHLPLVADLQVHAAK